MTENESRIGKFLLPFPPALVELAQALRSFFKEEGHPTYELVGDSTISVNIGYGFTTSGWDCYCAIIVYSKHINLSFPSGAYLKDPTGTLVGKGSRVRHVTVSNFGDLQNPDLLEIIKQARLMAQEDVEKQGKKHTTETVIKEVGGPKKRPS